MPTPFSRTLRSLDGDGHGSLWTLLIATALLVLWLGWFVGSRIAVYAATDDARVETGQAVHAIQAAVGGIVIGCQVALGARVRAGDVLCELESVAEQSRLREEKARRAALERQVDAGRAELQTQQLAIEQDRNARAAAIAEANADMREAAATSRRATDAASRLGSLRDSGRISALEGVHLQTQAEAMRAAAESRELHAQRLELEARVARSERLIRLQQLQRDLEQLGAQIASSSAAIQVLEQEIAKRQVRAPVDGRVGEVATIRRGAVIAAGERLATVVPDGELRIVADYAPAAALGRVRAGQQARFRLTGFPSAQYGAYPARVLVAGLEPRAGQVRVELQPTLGGAPLPVALRHGLPGRVEIEIERVAPVTLALRAAGRLVTRQQLAAAHP